MDTDNIWSLYGLALVALLFIFLSPFRDVLAYSLFIYYVARPLYHIFNRITHLKTIPAMVALAFIIAPIIYISSYTFTLAAGEVTSYINTLPADQKAEYIAYITDTLGISDIVDTPWHSISDISIGSERTGMILDLLNRSASFVGAFLGFVFNIVLVFFISFYLLRDGKNLREGLLENVFSGDRASERYFEETDKALSRIFLGNILNAMITGLLALIVYMLFNDYAPAHLQIPYPALLALLTGLASLVPMVGVKLVWVPTTVYLIIRSYLASALLSDLVIIGIFLLAVNIVVDLLPDMALRPFVTAKGYHSGAMLLAYIFGPVVFGISGIFIGPLILVLATNYVKIIAPALSRKHNVR